MRIRKAFLWGAVLCAGASCASAGIVRVAEGTQNKVLARVVSGGGWDTVVVITNLGPAPVAFQQFFLGPDGGPAAFRLEAQTANNGLAAAALRGTVGANASLHFTLRDSGDSIQEGWSLLSFDAAQGRLGGYAVIQHQTSSGALSEATVPLSDMQDFTVRMSFDNTGGFRSQLTLVNPAGNLAAQVSLTYFDPRGQVILLDVVQLQAGEQMTIDVPNTYPDLANQAGTVAVAANIDRLSVAGIRYSSASGAISPLMTMAAGGSTVQ